MKRFIEKVSSWFEQNAFGVCTWIGGKMGIRTTRIRMYFIYLTFFTAGSPILIYFILAFLLEHKDYFRLTRTRRRSVWDI